MDFYMVMSVVPFDPQAGATACQRCLRLYKALRVEAEAAGINRWALKPKIHMWQELAEFQAFDLGSPRAFWNYMDEDFVGWLAKLAHSRGGPNAFATSAKRVLDRYRALSALSR